MMALGAVAALINAFSFGRFIAAHEAYEKIRN